MSVLAVSSLTVGYGGIPAITDITVAVDAGQIVTVIGPNGADKSTLLNAIMGMIPGQGAIRFDGRDVAADPVAARVAAGMSLVPEKRELFATMSVEDNLRLGFYRNRAQGGRATQAALDDIFDLFPRLRERRPLRGIDHQRGALGNEIKRRAALGAQGGEIGRSQRNRPTGRQPGQHRDRSRDR